MASTIRLALIGAGNRGNAYGRHVLERDEDAQIVAIAEPIAERRERFSTAHHIPLERQFTTWEDLLARPKLADAVIIANQDAYHVAPAVAALRAGYDVLLEKPMANTLEGCVTLVNAAEETGQLLQICHVLRYTDFFLEIRRIVNSGRLGDVITVEHRENVAYYHMAHSYVRGNWRRKDETSPMILAKCCHDLDVLYWILGEKFTRLSSVGSLIHFRADQAPHPDVPDRCTEGCPVEDECPFYAPGIYLEGKPWRALAQAMGASPEFDIMAEMTWPMSTLANGDLSHDALARALEEGPYGRCVYRCDNDVVDHQVVTLETESGKSVALFMHGHSHEEGRTMRYDGTRATLEAFFTETRKEILVHDHLTRKTEVIHIPEAVGGHGGGDTGLMNAFLSSLRGEARMPLTDARAALESHLLAFAAEEARLKGAVIDMADYRAIHAGK